MSSMTPREIVQELDKHIVGQADAKRSVAIACLLYTSDAADDRPRV